MERSSACSCENSATSNNTGIRIRGKIDCLEVSTQVHDSLSPDQPCWIPRSVTRASRPGNFAPSEAPSLEAVKILSQY
ncbi:hypothetical protein WAI453_010530 [Rhynchosporium graminicola]